MEDTFRRLPAEAWTQSNRALARQLGCHHKTVAKWRQRLEPLFKSIEEPGQQIVHATSTLVRNPDEHGNVRLQWQKAKASHQVFLEAVERIAEELHGERDPQPGPPEEEAADKLAVVPFGDPHFGGLSWGEETGDENWDLERAESVHVEAVRSLVDVCPSVRRMLLVPLGDNLHANDRTASTPKSGHRLDVDGRWPKAVDVFVRTFRFAIDHALTKVPYVDVIVLSGNHDPDASHALARILKGYYHRCRRVYIDTSPRLFRHYEFGKNLLGFAHGHTKRPNRMSGLMPGLWPEKWGRTKHHAWYTGHVHHDSAMTLGDGSLVETFETLAPKDAYAAEGGWLSGRSARVDVWDKARGREMRIWHRLK